MFYTTLSFRKTDYLYWYLTIEIYNDHIGKNIRQSDYQGLELVQRRCRNAYLDIKSKTKLNAS